MVDLSPMSQYTSSNHIQGQIWKDLDGFHVSHSQKSKYYLGEEDKAYAKEGSTLKVHLYYHKSIHHYLSQTDL